MNKKSGFGLLEVLVASLVLGFMLVGLNILQSGNRESIIRIRARDGANAVAQDVIDSISALGSASVPVGKKWSCKKGVHPAPDTLEELSLCRERAFNNVVVDYSVVVEVKEVATDEKEKNVEVANEETQFVTAIRGSSESFKNIEVEHNIAKQVNVTVRWNHKKSEQSINMSAIVK